MQPRYQKSASSPCGVDELGDLAVARLMPGERQDSGGGVAPQRRVRRDRHAQRADRGIAAEDRRVAARPRGRVRRRRENPRRTEVALQQSHRAAAALGDEWRVRCVRGTRCHLGHRRRVVRRDGGDQVAYGSRIECSDHARIAAHRVRGQGLRRSRSRSRTMARRDPPDRARFPLGQHRVPGAQIAAVDPLEPVRPVLAAWHRAPNSMAPGNRFLSTATQGRPSKRARIRPATPVRPLRSPRGRPARVPHARAPSARGDR